MVVAVKVPAVGESITEGTIARWLKKEGDWVQANEPLFELETEKATTTVPAPASGAVHLLFAEGQTVPIGAVVAQIDPAATPSPRREDKAAAPAAAAEAASTPTPSSGTPSLVSAPTLPWAEPVPPPPPTAPRREPAAAPLPDNTFPETKSSPLAAAPPGAPAETPPLSPAVRHLLEEAGLRPEEVPATGPGGRLTKEDVLRYLEQRAASAATPTPSAAPTATPPPQEPLLGERETRQRLSAIRQRIAERLVTAQKTTATLTTFNEADLSAVLAWRQRYQEPFQARYGVKLGLMSFFVKACVQALKEFPIVNSRIDGQEIVTYHYYHIGVAVSTDKGLMVPVVRDADRLSFAAIEQTIAELAAKARQGRISVTELQGGTFTISNGGVFGSLLSTPLLNFPQSAILGMHAIQKRPVVVNDQIVVRPMMYLALSYDHRLIDGREAVLFLARIKECIEAPERLLLEV